MLGIDGNCYCYFSILPVSSPIYSVSSEALIFSLILTIANAVAADKNHGWDILIEAKRCFDNVVASGKLNKKQLAAAEQQLAVCEGSDWFWWFGDYNPAETVSDFEHLYRTHLARLYTLLGQTPPNSLSMEVSHGSGAPEHGGAMRRGQ